ncbi:50S ribosomal protein L19 [Candidatus Endomicrobiellum trichonymphae]|uniref:Large ribosomal subunit protein bL19 n=1 Tax=Endomicrobium trichonymphae TaxID=1408204 RepID=A0A1E5ILF4_ENDTX|nr:50S ribosomal protein L19 [Candidatus Endomicrobium trichonymphae]OEG71332.1 50S ribosomal protein L19 [Candidatus Endomicrobium trichonymphae]
MSLLEQVQAAQKRDLGVSFKSGDQIKVHFKIVEGGNERIQIFEGIVIRIKGSGLSETFTVRKISFGIGIERIFPIHSPRIDKIEVLKRGKVRRAKLYYLRNLSGKAARISEDSSRRNLKKETVKQVSAAN